MAGVFGGVVVGAAEVKVGSPASAVSADRPNIVFLLADDLGYGDVSSNNPKGKIPTPGIDRLAREGMRFTDAHSASAVCSPTRYGLLTGRYPWRTRLQRGVLKIGKRKMPDGTEKFGDAPLIAEDVLTVPEFLKENGYDTAMVGKWHLGFWYELPEGAQILPGKKPMQRAAPVGTRVIDGPITRGFDFFRGFHHAGEMCTWIEQDKVTENLKSAEEMLPRITKASVDYILDPARRKRPFFLYVPFNSPHAPIVPTAKWRGKSGINAYADYMMETADAVGQILDALDQAGLARNTLVVFTADNGTSPKANFAQLHAAGHDPVGGLRGHKADAWDGGHRVPYFVRWPGVVKPGSVTSELVCHNSLLATSAEILGKILPKSAAPDSFSILPVLKGETPEHPTHPVVIQASNRGCFAIRQGKWKFIACKGSGGWSKGDDGKPAQLYDMSRDIAERRNLLDEKPEIVARMKALLEKAVNDGHTVPGKSGVNDVKVTIYKKSGSGKKRKPKGRKTK